jgi:hypothetical protein
MEHQCGTIGRVSGCYGVLFHASIAIASSRFSLLRSSYKDSANTNSASSRVQCKITNFVVRSWRCNLAGKTECRGNKPTVYAYRLSSRMESCTHIHRLSHPYRYFLLFSRKLLGQLLQFWDKSNGGPNPRPHKLSFELLGKKLPRFLFPRARYVYI